MPKNPPFEKGNEYGKLGGRPPIPEDVKEARRMLKSDFERVAQQVMRMTQYELNNFIKNSKTTALELTVASIIGKALSKGDQTRLGFILDRVVGPITKKIDLGKDTSGGDETSEPVAALTGDELTSSLMALQRLIQKKEDAECKSTQKQPQYSESPVPLLPQELDMGLLKRKSEDSSES